MIFLKLVVLDETKKANYSEQNGYGGGGGGIREVEDPLIKDIVTVRNTEY